MSEPLSLRAYAKRRGCSAMAVSQAVRDGRLKESVVRAPNGDPKISDPFLADREWAVNSDLMKAPAAARIHAQALAAESAAKMEAIGTPLPDLAPDGESGDPATHLKRWQAKLAELKYREAARELVPVDEMRREVTDMIARAKVRILTIPSLLRQRLPHLTQTDSAIVDETLREALEELATDE